MTLDEIERLLKDHVGFGYPPEYVEVRGLGVGDIRALLEVARAAKGLQSRCREFANDWEYAEQSDGYDTWNERLSDALAKLEHPT